MPSSSDSGNMLAMPVVQWPSQPPPPGSPASAPRDCFTIQRPLSTKVEDVELYRWGGHHPVNIGDVIRGRYRIVHKLGHGGWALVWLARDVLLGRYVALKILKGHSREPSMHEEMMLKYLRDICPNLPMAHLRDSFKLRGTNARAHPCFVMDFIGPTWSQVRLSKAVIPSIQWRKEAARSLAEGVAGFHAAGVCHGGLNSPTIQDQWTNSSLDLTDINVMFQIEGIHDWTDEELYRYLGPVKSETLVHFDGTPVGAFAPRAIIEPLDYSNFDLSQLSSKCVLADFGEAYFIDQPPEELGTPPMFAAPERLFGYTASEGADLWALGGLIYEISSRDVFLPLFFHADIEALMNTIEMIGALPESWRGLYHDKARSLEDGPEGRHRWFDTSLARQRGLEELIPKELPSLSGKEQTALIDLLRKVLVFEPSHRLRAAEISNHAWFTDVYDRDI